MATAYTKTVDGYERQFAVNHLAHFTLSVLLLPALMEVSSSSHRYSSVDLEDVHYENIAAYGQSKAAMIWGANFLNRVYGPRGVHALSIHPGGIWSGLRQYMDQTQVSQWKYDKDVTRQMKSPQQGAAMTVWAAVSPIEEGKGGVYLAGCKLTEASTAEDPNSELDDGYGSHAFDEEKEQRLWGLNLESSGVPEP